METPRLEMFHSPKLAAQFRCSPDAGQSKFQFHIFWGSDFFFFVPLVLSSNQQAITAGDRIRDWLLLFPLLIMTSFPETQMRNDMKPVLYFLWRCMYTFKWHHPES
jgi:hypothetical protein